MELKDLANINGLIPGLNAPGSGEYGEQYEIVSRVAYLIGVPKRIFENDHEPPKIEIFNMLEKEKPARIIRNLCAVRTQLEHNFLKICKGIQREGRSIIGMPEYIPSEMLQSLYNDGIDIYKFLREPTPFLININQNIKNRINNCRSLFPDWIDWNYLSEIFLMPGGFTEAGTKQAAEFYYANMQFYPYGQYLNWPAEDQGNILRNDWKFVSLLYQWNNDEFVNKHLVSDVTERTKGNIYNFIDESDKCIFIVDCENSDPYNLCAAINNLDQEKLSKIERIILFDDVHAASAWEMLSSYINIPVEYTLIERLKDNKSLADVKVAARASKEFYLNKVDSFVLVSSDSDFWGLIEELEEARFMVMVEHEKCSYALKEALIKNDIFYCYIDDFYAGGGEKIKTSALQREIGRLLQAEIDVNLYNIVKEALAKTRIFMTTDEINNFIKNKVRNNLNLEITDDGDIEIKYRVKK